MFEGYVLVLVMNCSCGCCYSSEELLSVASRVCIHAVIHGYCTATIAWLCAAVLMAVDTGS